MIKAKKGADDSSTGWGDALCFSSLICTIDKRLAGI